VQRQKKKEKEEKADEERRHFRVWGFFFNYYFLLAKRLQKVKFEIRQRSHFGGFQSPEVREKKTKKRFLNRHIHVISLHFVAKNTEV
jgi:hypothetical protein